jgi:hypothetical protein
MKVFTLRSQLSNPFDRWDYFNNLGCISGRLFGHLAWELEHTFYSPALFDIDCTLSTQEDHAGFEITIGLLGYGVHFRICDTRHWNYDTNTWEVYNV